MISPSPTGDGGQVTLQLKMLWPQNLLGGAPVWPVPTGYALRTYRPGDEESYLRVMQSAGFPWKLEDVPRWTAMSLPDGLFFAVHRATNRIVATAGAFDRSPEGGPPLGELGWVACDPEHQGNGLGGAVCAAVIARFMKARYTDIYLLTDDHRLPAIKTYLKLGFVPLLHAPDMEGRWREVYRQLGMAYEGR